MRQSQTNKNNKEVSSADLVEVLISDLSKLEEDLDLFDIHVPTVLQKNIDIVAIDKNDQLVLIIVEPKKITPQRSIDEALKIYYLWNYVCDFREDFFVEAREQKQIELAPRPPRIILVTPNVPGKLWLFLKWIRKSFIRIRVFTFDETKTSEFEPKRIDWPQDIKPPSRSDLHRFNLENSKWSKKHHLTWEALIGQDEIIAGYDKNRTMEKALKKFLSRIKGRANVKIKT